MLEVYTEELQNLVYYAGTFRVSANIVVIFNNFANKLPQWLLQKYITSSPITTIIVLVQENRSFDHMLGWMNTLNPNINGPTRKSSNPISTSNAKSDVLIFGNQSLYVDPDPGHSIQDVYEQIFGVPWSKNLASKKLQPTMKGFAQNAERNLKGTHKPFRHFFNFHFDFCRNLRKLKYIKNFHQFDLHFKNHCKEGKLPNYVVIEQRYFDLKILPGNDDHPSHDVFEGQKFVKQVYEALRSSPQWNEILFIIIYDEHGGFFDHVPTPVTGVPSPDGINGPEPYKFQFNRLGVRVPAILISPWIERGTVLHKPSGPYATSEFEHSSIPATVKKIFNLSEFLTKRDAWAGTFETVINRTTPRTDCPETLPEPVRLREAEAKEDAKLTDYQTEMVQMAAVLCGDHLKDSYPHKLVEDMTVAEAAEYVDKAFNKFLDECEKVKLSGADDSTICVPTELPGDYDERASTKFKSFASKFLSCVLCDH
uniref:Non-specific phospholipase C3-like n=1 Tax=Nicotiana tabacum TaxID=4097 RepID=A0A1S4AMP0_TOBAC|nr:PREDICTED: non-specific phospholipase C3-like [Nicotiana tabacum]